MYAVLEITSWIGISVGAQHYYGKIKYTDQNREYQHYELMNTLTQKDATVMNKYEIWFKPNSTYRYKKGDIIEGFPSEDAIRKVAIKWFKKNLPSYDILLEGRSSVLSVQKCLYSKDISIMNKINELYIKADKLGFYDLKKNEKKMDKIDEQFRKIIGWGNV